MSGHRRTDPEAALALLRAAAERALSDRSDLEPVDAAVLGNGDAKLIHWAPRLSHAGLVLRLSGVVGAHTDLDGVEHPVYDWQEEGWTGAPAVLCNGATAWLQYFGATGAGYSVTEALPRRDVLFIAAHRPDASRWTAAVSDTGSPTLVALLAHWATSRESFLAVSTGAVRDAILREVPHVDPQERSWARRLEDISRYVTATVQTMNVQQRETVEALAADGWQILAAIDVALALGDG
jgi:hypothetical protein